MVEGLKDVQILLKIVVTFTKINIISRTILQHLSTFFDLFNIRAQLPRTGKFDLTFPQQTHVLRRKFVQHCHGKKLYTLFAPSNEVCNKAIVRK